MAEGQPAPSAPAARAERVYEAEELIHKARMVESDFCGALVGIIEQELLSKRCKLALYSVIFMAFDKNVVLANNPDIELRVLRLMEALNKAKLSYTRPDVMNPSIVYIHETIIQHFRDFVSRSYKMGERRMQGERKTVTEAQYGSPETGDALARGGNKERGFDIGESIASLRGGR